MTDKKEQILLTALELFAHEGYKGVSTSKIALEAKVSEGLIFKHFGNKQGLLDSIMNLATEKTIVVFKNIIEEENPKKVIEKSIKLPFEIKKEELDFWKLEFKLKWELELSGKEKMKPLIDKLGWAFDQLNYKDPHNEAEILNHIMESVFSGILREGLESQIALKDFLLNKYRIATTHG